MNGEKVAVKIKYPDIGQIIQTDLQSSRRVAQVYQYFDNEPMQFLPLMDELQIHLKLELDFRREVESADRIRALFLDDKHIHIIKITKRWHRSKLAIRKTILKFAFTG